MTRPSCTTARPNLRANGETDPSARELMAEAARLVAALDLRLSPAMIRLLIARYRRADPVESFAAWFLGYADPTGDDAVRNVLTTMGNR